MSLKKHFRSEYNSWCGARWRCHAVHNKDYIHYGARGIKMCEEWRNDFAAFLAHIGPKPEPALTLDRIDNDRGYEPNNVRWATRKAQTNNRRNSRPPEQQRQKAKHRPLKVERPKTLTANVANAARARLVTIDGVTDTLSGWANRTGLTKETIRYRVNNNYTGKDIITRDDLRLEQRQLRKSNKRQTK